MASVVGQLEIQLLANIARLQQDMDKATRTVDRAMSGVQKSVDIAQKALLGLGAGLTFGALVSNVNKAIDTLGKLDDMAQKTGSSVENLSRLQKVATQFGGDFDAVNVGLNKLAKGLNGIDDASGKTATALNAIGISQAFVKANDPSQVFVEVAKRLQNYQDGAGKAALATDLFGKSGVELLPYLNDVAENVDKFTGATAQAAAQAAAVQDKMGGLKVKFDEVFQTLAISLLPVMSDFLDDLTGTNKQATDLANNKTLHEWADSLADKFAFAADAINAMAIPFKYLGNLAAQTAALITPRANPNASAIAINQAGADYNAELVASASYFRDRLAANRASGLTAASPYVSPNADKPQVDYIDAETKAKLAAEAKAASAARLKELQKEIDFETEATDALNKYQSDEDKKQAAAKLKLTENAFEMDRKFIEVLDKTETKILDDSHKAKLNYFEDENRRINDAIKARADKEKKYADEINKAITDALFRGFESGKSFIKNFIDTLKNAFQTTVLRPIISAIIDTSGIPKLVSGIVGGITGSVGNSTASGGGLFSSIGKIFTTSNDAIYKGIESIGSSIANGLGGIRDSIGGFISQNSQVIGNLSSYAGAVLQLAQGNYIGAAATAIGTVIGGPIGGAIGSFVGGLFGGHVMRPKYYADTRVSESGATLLRGWQNDGNKSTLSQTNATFTSAAGSIANISKALGGTIAKEFQVAFTYNQKHNLYGINVGRGTTKGEWDVYGNDRNGGFTEAIANAALLAMKKGFIKLPEYLNNVLSRGGSGTDALNSLSSIKSLYESLDSLPKVFSAIKTEISLFASASTASVTALKASMDSIATYVQLFYTDQEKFDTLKGQLTKAFTGLGQTLPETRDGFRKLVDGIDTTTASGLGLFNAFVALAPTVDGYYKAIQAQSDATKQATDNAYALADALNTNKFKNVVDFTRAQMYQQNGIPLSQLPSFADGSNMLPSDMVAQVHAGERIVPAADNQAIIQALNGDSETKNLLRELIIEVRAGNLPQIQAVQKIEKYLSRIDDEGVVISEIDRTGTRTTLDTRVVA